MGCGASVDAGQVHRKALVSKLVVTIHDPQSKNAGKDAPGQSTGAPARFAKGEATVVLLLGATDFTAECSADWARVTEEFGFARMGLKRFLREGPKEESERDEADSGNEMKAESDMGLEKGDLDDEATEAKAGVTERGNADPSAIPPSKPALASGFGSASFDVPLRNLLAAIRRMPGRRLLTDGSQWTVRDVEAFEAIVAPIDLVFLFEYPQDVRQKGEPEVAKADVSGHVGGRGSTEADVSSQLDAAPNPKNVDSSGQPGTDPDSSREHVSNNAQGLLIPHTADVNYPSESGRGAAAKAADRFSPLRNYFENRARGAESDVIFRVLDGPSTSAADVAEVLHTFVPSQVDEYKRLAEEDKRWAAVMAAAGGPSEAPANDKESPAEKFRKEYPWVVPLRGVASFCVRLTERYWAWFDPEPKDDEFEDD